MTSKQALRTELGRRRSARPSGELDAAGPALARRSLALPELATAKVVACYLSTGLEPPTWQLVEELRQRGATVLCPVMASGRVLDWAAYVGETAPAAHGIAEPTGPRLGAGALATAEVIVLPAMAVDRHGNRLGRGAGYYDHALTVAAPTAARIALVFDDEVLAGVPVEPHDQPVHRAITPLRTLTLRDLPRTGC